MPWFYLLLAISLEVAGTVSMKLSEGFSHVGPTVGMVVFYLLSFAMLTLAIKQIDLSVAYAIWSGVGTALVVAVGFAWFKEPVIALKLVSITLIIAGVAGLQLSAQHA